MNKGFRIVSINLSEQKGTGKKPVKEGLLKEKWGLVGDAHGGVHMREVSLLAIESIRKFSRQLSQQLAKNSGVYIGPGDFAENITTEGFNLGRLKIGTRLKLGEEAIIEITQRGKECHLGCEIRRVVGNCIMPKEGLFAKVIYPGKIKVGDKITVLD